MATAAVAAAVTATTAASSMDPLSDDLDTTCESCQKTFPFYGLLEKHLVDIHGENEMLSCGTCRTTFKRKMNAILHWRSVLHRENKLIGCDICDAFNVMNGFRDEKDLLEHTMSVHGETVFVNPPVSESDSPGGASSCPLCRKHFSHRKGMIEHLQVIHQEHLYGDLLQESSDSMASLLSQQLLRCDECPKTFRVKSTLNRHREKFHRNSGRGVRLTSSSGVGVFTAVQPRKILPGLPMLLPKPSPSPLPTLPMTQAPVTTLIVNPLTANKPVNHDTIVVSGPTTNILAGGKSLLPGSITFSSGSKYLGPGSQNLSHGSKSLSPGSKNLSPGSKYLGPGSQNLSLAPKTLTPGSKYPGPGSKSLVPGTKPLGPAAKNTFTGFRKTMPGLRPLAPAQAPTPVPKSTGVTCQFCQRSFTRQSVLDIHIDCVHRDKKGQPQPQPQPSTSSSDPGPDPLQSSEQTTGSKSGAGSPAEPNAVQEEVIVPDGSTTDAIDYGELEELEEDEEDEEAEKRPVSNEETDKEKAEMVVSTPDFYQEEEESKGPTATTETPGLSSFVNRRLQFPLSGRTIIEQQQQRHLQQQRQLLKQRREQQQKLLQQQQKPDSPPKTARITVLSNDKLYPSPEQKPVGSLPASQSYQMQRFRKIAPKPLAGKTTGVGATQVSVLATSKMSSPFTPVPNPLLKPHRPLYGSAHPNPMSTSTSPKAQWKSETASKVSAPQPSMTKQPFRQQPASAQADFEKRLQVGAGDSSSEEDEDATKFHKNVIVKRLANADYDDEEYSPKVKKLASTDTVRTSARIRTKRRSKSSEEDEKKEPKEASCSEVTEAAAQDGANNLSDGTLKSEMSSEAGSSTSPEEASSEDATPELSKAPTPPPKAPLELVEACYWEGCTRKFSSYFSMKRHVAFKHQPEKTMELMKVRPLSEQNNPTVMSN